MKTAIISSSNPLQSQLVEKDNVIDQLNRKVAYLEEPIEWFKRQIFGKKVRKGCA